MSRLICLRRTGPHFLLSYTAIDANFATTALDVNKTGLLGSLPPSLGQEALYFLHSEGLSNSSPALHIIEIFAKTLRILEVIIPPDRLNIDHEYPNPSGEE